MLLKVHHHAAMTIIEFHGLQTEHPVWKHFPIRSLSDPAVDDLAGDPDRVSNTNFEPLIEVRT